MARVLIGCPTCDLYDSILSTYLAHVKKTDYPDFDLVMVDNSKGMDFFNKLKKMGLNVIKSPHLATAKESIVASREILRKKCIDEGYDYFFSLEQDVLVKPDTLSKLVSHGKDIITAYYGYNVKLTLADAKGAKSEQIINVPIIYLETRPGFIKRANAKDLVYKGVREIAAAGVGCMLISRKALEKISFKVNSKQGFDDTLFCKEAREAGYTIWLDGDIILHHLNRDWKEMGIKD